MGATLDALHRLQEIENELRDVQEQIEAKRRRIHSHRRRLAKLEHDLAETQAQIRKTQAEADDLELQRKSHEAHITKLREALNQAKSNKEYAAILTQLNTDKADATKLEDAILSKLNRVDELKKSGASVTETLAQEQSRVGEIEESNAAVEARLAAQLSELEARREDAAEQIPPEILNVFQRACDRHEGEALASIERMHPKRAEYICSGCNMSIPLETINALQSRDEVQQCNNCLRILYLDTASKVAR